MTSTTQLPDLVAVPDAQAVEAAARSFDAIGSAVDRAMNSIKASWAGLSTPGVFETPDSARLADALSGSAGVASKVDDDSSTAKTALLAYAKVLEDLAKRRSALAESVTAQTLTVGDLDPLDPHAPGTSDADPHRWLESSITGFNSDVSAADSNCAAALRHLLQFPGDQALYGAEAAGRVLSSPPSALLLSATGDAIGSKSGFRDSIVGMAELLRLKDPTGRHVGTVTAGGEEAIEAPTKSASPKDLVDSSEAPPTTKAALHSAQSSRVLRYAAKAGGFAVGAIASVGSGVVVGSQTYEKDVADHPDWDDDRRKGHALRHGAISGGIDLAAGAGEAAIGAAIGTAILPVGGTIVGGLIGGLVGGILLEKPVNDIADNANELADENFGV